MKYKLVELDRYLREHNLEDEIIMILTIHDSVVLEILNDKLDQHISTIKEILENAQCAPFNLRVPITVDYGKGQNWSEATYGAAA